MTLAAFLRQNLPERSWSDVRRLVETRHVRINDELCIDSARRLHVGEVVELSSQPAASPKLVEHEIIRFLDGQIVVAEKPSGMNTVRHPSEREWPLVRKQRSPALEDILPPLIVRREGRSRKGPPPRLRVVQRLDKETSGLVVFARTPLAERELGGQFRRHTVIRRYLALVPGLVPARRVATRLLRDRGDGRRGSTTLPGQGKESVTHLSVEEQLPDYTLLSCRLETGRTHQIRIHLAELGHPICGEKVYNRKANGEFFKDDSGAPRLFLHAAELGFVHPVTNESMHWEMPLPADLQDCLTRLRRPQSRTTKDHGNSLD